MHKYKHDKNSSDDPLYHQLIIKDGSDMVFNPTEVEIYQTMVESKVCAYFRYMRGCGTDQFRCDGCCSHYGQKWLQEDPTFKPFRTAYEIKEEGEYLHEWSVAHILTML